jgi:predicted O-methyltransferase YrrM
MNAVLESILARREVTSSEGERRPLSDEITPGDGMFLQEVLRAVRPRQSLEVGMAYGVSSLYICEVLAEDPDSRHVVVDPYQNVPGPWGDSWRGIGIDNIRRAGYDHIVEFVGQPTSIALPRLFSTGRRFDFAFIDGFHVFDAVLVDFYLVDLLLKPQGVVVFHDADWDSVRKALRYVVTNRSYEVYRCFPEMRGFRKRRYRAKAIVAKALGKVFTFAKPEYSRPDMNLGLEPKSRCVALRKKADDARGHHAHRPF